MVAGLNSRISIWRITQDADDSVGGAQPTGTVAYQNVLSRIQANPEEQLLLQQGLETIRTFTGVIAPGTLGVKERDEIEVTAPNDHPYYGDRFRVVSFRYSSHNPRDKRNYIMLTLTRVVEAHASQ